MPKEVLLNPNDIALVIAEYANSLTIVTRYGFKLSIATELNPTEFTRKYLGESRLEYMTSFKLLTSD